MSSHSFENKTPELAPTIELSFDDVPYNPEAVQRISEFLKCRGIYCDFFAVGSAIKERGEVLRYLSDSGHRVQNHSWSHRRLDRLGHEEVRYELEHTQKAIFDATSVPPTKFRSPYGAGGWNRLDAPVLWSEIERLGLENYTWDVDSGDWKGPKGISPSKIEGIRLQILQRICQKHLVILLHATTETANDLPVLLEHLNKWNLTVVSSRTLSNSGNLRMLTSRDSALKYLTQHRERKFRFIWNATEANFIRLKKYYERRGSFTLPDSLIATLVAGEDKRYLQHSGFDIWAIGRACWKRILGKREGASTIPQQLARVLTGRYERTISRKIMEIRIAFRMSRTFKKSEIATLYLHVAYYGWRMNSLEQAAHQLGIAIPSCGFSDAAKLVARLKYPQPRHIYPNKFQSIKARERHLFNLVKKTPLEDLIPKNNEAV